MGRIIPLIIITFLLLLIDFYSFKAINSVFKNWTDKQRKIFKNIYWGYAIALVLGVFASIFFGLNIGLRAVILVAFFITFVTKFCLFLKYISVNGGTPTNSSVGYFCKCALCFALFVSKFIKNHSVTAIFWY